MMNGWRKQRENMVNPAMKRQGFATEARILTNYSQV